MEAISECSDRQTAEEDVSSSFSSFFASLFDGYSEAELLFLRREKDKIHRAIGNWLKDVVSEGTDIKPLGPLQEVEPENQLKTEELDLDVFEANVEVDDTNDFEGTGEMLNDDTEEFPKKRGKRKIGEYAEDPDFEVTTSSRRKRGRPRKFAPDGSLVPTKKKSDKSNSGGERKPRGRPRLGNGKKGKQCCSVCGAFVLHLAPHMLVHTKERPWPCEVCGAAFPTRASQQRHYESLHTTYRRFVCEECGRGFVLRSRYNLHMKTHLNIRNYTCDVCGKAFITGTKLKYHKFVHSGERPYACNICEFETTRPEYLKGHLRSRHGVDQPKKANSSTYQPRLIRTIGPEPQGTSATSGIPALQPAIGMSFPSVPINGPASKINQDMPLALSFTANGAKPTVV